MAPQDTNVVRLLPLRHRGTGCSERRGLGVAQNLDAISQLSLHLRTLKRELTEASTDCRRACIAVDEPGLQHRLSTYLEQVEALEAGMHRLIDAMSTHQPR